jgi:hypothetical protein
MGLGLFQFIAWYAFFSAVKPMPAARNTTSAIVKKANPYLFFIFHPLLIFGSFCPVNPYKLKINVAYDLTPHLLSAAA